MDLGALLLMTSLHENTARLKSQKATKKTGISLWMCLPGLP